MRTAFASSLLVLSLAYAAPGMAQSVQSVKQPATPPKPKVQAIVDKDQDTEVQPTSKWPSKDKSSNFYDSVRLPAHLVGNDVDNALLLMRWAWAESASCSSVTVCAKPISRLHFRWDDGTEEVGPIIQRWTASPHDCIQNAGKALKDKHRALAVEWVMASEAHNTPAQQWIRLHPGAVLDALQHVTS
jgi:hypothetical protein